MGEVTDFTGITRNEIAVEDVLDGPKLRKARQVLVIAWDEDDALMITASNPSYRDNFYLLTLGEQFLIDNLKASCGGSF